jgi:hypothetical protein
MLASFPDTVYHLLLEWLRGGHYVAFALVASFLLLSLVSSWARWWLQDPRRELTWLRRMSVGFAVWLACAGVATRSMPQFLLLLGMAGLLLVSAFRAYAVCARCGKLVWSGKAWARPEKCSECGARLALSFVEDQKAVLRLTLRAMRQLEAEGRIGYARDISRQVEETTGFWFPRSSVDRALQQLERGGLLEWDTDHWRVAQRAADEVSPP